jgi:hypothetical protein
MLPHQHRYITQIYVAWWPSDAHTLLWKVAGYLNVVAECMRSTCLLLNVLDSVQPVAAASTTYCRSYYWMYMFGSYVDWSLHGANCEL